MVVTTPDGYVIDVLGPEKLWQASASDAKILLELMTTDWFHGVFRKGDVFVLDRGFRGAVPALLASGFVVKTPEFLPKGKKQLPTEQANKSRLCTKVRWVVEHVNAQLKRYKYLAQTVPMPCVPGLYQDIRISAAVHSAFGKRVASDKDDFTVAERILQQYANVNYLQALVIREKLSAKRSVFKDLTESSDLDFPELSP